MCLPAAGQNAWSEADCVTLLDSTSVTVQPNGSGSFAVYKSFKVQTPKGAVNNHVIKYDYDPLTAFARFKQVTVQRANGETMQVELKMMTHVSFRPCAGSSTTLFLFG